MEKITGQRSLDVFDRNRTEVGTWFKTHQGLDKLLEENQKLIQKKFESELTLIQKIFDQQNKTYLFFQPSFQLTGETEQDIIHHTAFMKNLLALKSALILNQKGLTGSSRQLLRQCFEYLLLAKYISLTNDEEVFNNWQLGKHIYVRKKILNHITKPKSVELITFLEVLNQASHASIYSQQPTLDQKQNSTEIYLNFVFMRILLEMNQHLLTKHIITNSHIYYARTYAKWDPKGLLRKLRNLSSESKDISLTNNSKKLIREFSSKWCFD